MSRVILITGVSRFLGSRLAASLAGDPAVDRVIGIDTVPPRANDLALLGRTEFVRADIRNPLVAKVMSQAGVHTVVHAALLASPRTVGRSSMQELNVIGTMQLLAACQRSETVQRVVLRSTTAVYGCGSRDPAVFTEDTPVSRGATLGGYPKDAAEVEAYVRGFARRRPDVPVAVLRFAPVLGPTVENEFTRYLRGPIVPTAAGFDPRLQVLHEADAVEVLRLATVSDRPGVANVAGDGVVSLAQLIRRGGRTRLPVPDALLAAAGRAVGARTDFAVQQPGYLRYGRAVDTTRLRERFGYVPRFSTAETVEAWAGASGGPHLAVTALGVGSQLLRVRFAYAPRLRTAGR